MNKIALTAELREKSNKNANFRLRKAGKIPAVVYGSKDAVSITLDQREFNSKFKTISENILIDLSVGKDSYQVFVKDYQKNNIAGLIQHIDFLEVEKGKLLKTHVPIQFEGNPEGVKEGGLLEHKLEVLEVECLPKDMPAYFTVDISGLGMGDAYHISDLPEIKGVKVLSTGDQTIAVVTAPKAEKAETDDELGGEMDAAAIDEAAAESAE